MSLGSSYGSPEDPDAVAANNLAALGTVVVASMGNSGDVYEVGGSPGDAPRVLAVAASDAATTSSTASVLNKLARTQPGISPPGELSEAYDQTNKAGRHGRSARRDRLDVDRRRRTHGNNADGAAPR